MSAFPKRLEQDGYTSWEILILYISFFSGILISIVVVWMFIFGIVYLSSWEVNPIPGMFWGTLFISVIVNLVFCPNSLPLCLYGAVIFLEFGRPIVNRLKNKRLDEIAKKNKDERNGD